MVVKAAKPVVGQVTERTEIPLNCRDVQPLPASPNAKFVAEYEMLAPCKPEFGVSSRLGERIVSKVEPKSVALAPPLAVIVNGPLAGIVVK